MFICEECLDKKYHRPLMAARSRGPCEICRMTAVCYDIPSKYLGGLRKHTPMEDE